MRHEIPKSSPALKPATPHPRPDRQGPHAAVLRWLEGLNARFWRALARAAGESGPARGVGARAARVLRILVLAALSFTVNEVPVRAAALVFTTILAFIPLTIILSSVAGWMGYLSLVRDLIPNLMASLNLDLPIDFLMQGLERAESLGFHQLGLMGSVGLLIGFYLSMSNVEQAMNRVWNVRDNRGWVGRFTRYTPFLVLLLLLMVGSVFLLFQAHHFLSAFLEDWGVYGSEAMSFTLSLPGGAVLFGSLGALVFLWALMALMIRLLPNAKVRMKAALIGATAGIVPLYALTRLLLLFPAMFIARNQMFYGSLAIVPVALLFVYVFWSCVLFGCAVAFVHERLRRNAGHLFFARGKGLRADWQAALRETAELYRRHHG